MGQVLQVQGTVSLVMRILIIGGNRFLGIELTARLLAGGHAVTLLNRGTLNDPFGARVQRLRADRSTDAFDQALSGTHWDCVVDFALFNGAQTERLIRVLNGRVGHVVAISSGQVYLVRSPRPLIATESDFEGPVMTESPSLLDEEQWRYGIEKRDVETRLTDSTMPYTILRLPMVHGGRDDKRRLDSILWRMMDGGPILLTQPDAPVRHVYSGAVVRAIEGLLVQGAQKQSFNLAWSEALTAKTFIEHIGRAFGKQPRLEICSWEQASKAGIDPVQACVVNSRWMSALDASLAEKQLSFVHEPIDVWLPGVVHALISRWTEAPPSLGQRSQEL